MGFKCIVESKNISEEIWTIEGVFLSLEEAREFVYKELRRYTGFDYRIRKICSEGEYFYDR